MEAVTLKRARGGDEQAFRELADPCRRELLVHCYRLLGSLTDAEDVLQETLLAAWRGLAGFRGDAAFRSWLYRIATSRCLNAMRANSRRAPAEPVPPFAPPEPSRRGEVTWLQPFPDSLLEQVPDAAPGPEDLYQRSEMVELAFVAALQRMAPRQAAALVLSDVIGFSAAEVAGMLDASPAAVKGLLQRARRSVSDGTRGRVRTGSAAERELSRRFADAYVSGDIDAVVELLSDNAWLSMPPAPHEYHGADAIRSFLRASFGWRGDRPVILLPCRASTQPAFGSYLGAAAGAVASPAGLIVLTTDGDRIGAITRFHIERLYPRYGLPASLPAGSGTD